MLNSYVRISLSFLAVITYACASISPARAKLFDSPVDRLPPIQRDSLHKGRVVVMGENGKYVARVLVVAPPEVVWSVLTDYVNFPRFIPNMLSSKVLENKGSRKVVEQIDSRRIFFVTVRSRTKLAISETTQQQIDFRLIDGDLDSLEGSWKMEPVSPIPGKPATQVLITHTVDAQPTPSTPKDTFYEIFKDSLVQTLKAVSNEVNRRLKA